MIILALLTELTALIILQDLVMGTGQCQDTEFEINSCNRGRRNKISFVHAIHTESPEDMKSFLLTNVQEKT